MTNIEEILWAYIDGTCSVDEKQTIAAKIANDKAVKAKYVELLELNSEIAQMELDEPSMAFTYNVIETVREQEAARPLKTQINRNIILGISLFFILSIAILLAFTIGSFNWSFIAESAGTTKDYKIPVLSVFISKPIKEGFLFFDVVLAMFLLDNYLRRKIIHPQKNTQ